MKKSPKKRCGKKHTQQWSSVNPHSGASRSSRVPVSGLARVFFFKYMFTKEFAALSEPVLLLWERCMQMSRGGSH